MIDNLYALTEVATSTAFILWGVAFVIRPDLVKKAMTYFLEDSKASTQAFIIAYVGLPIASCIVWVHNEWVLDFPVVVTLFGWVVLIKCFLWLVMPGTLLKWAKSLSFLQEAWFIRTVSVLFIVLGWFIVSNYIYFIEI